MKTSEKTKAKNGTTATGKETAGAPAEIPLPLAVKPKAAPGAATASQETTSSASGTTPSGTTATPRQPNAALIAAISAADWIGNGTVQQRLTRALQVVNQIPIILGSAQAPAKALSIQQRRALPKLRKGGAAEAPQVLKMAEKYGVALQGGGVAEARADMEYAAMVELGVEEMVATTAIMRDAAAQANGRWWDTSIILYGLLARLQRRFPALQTELGSMATFMAIKHKAAPSILRSAEANTLEKSRTTRKTPKAGGTSAPEGPPSPAPAGPGGSSGQPTQTPVAPPTNSPAAAPAAAPTNGVAHN